MSGDTSIKYLTNESFAEAIASGLVLVDFTAEWCGPCRMLAPVLEKVAEQMKGKASIVKVDTDNCQDTAAEFSITSIPTMILFKDGVEIDRVMGLKDEETLTELLSSNV